MIDLMYLESKMKNRRYSELVMIKIIQKKQMEIVKTKSAWNCLGCDNSIPKSSWVFGKGYMKLCLKCFKEVMKNPEFFRGNLIDIQNEVESGKYNDENLIASLSEEQIK